MPPKRGSANPRSRSAKFRLPIITLLLISLVAPLLFLAVRLGNFIYLGIGEFDTTVDSSAEDERLNALQKVETLLPKEVLDVIKSNEDDSGPLSLNVIGRTDLSSSWVVEKSSGKRAITEANFSLVQEPVRDEDRDPSYSSGNGSTEFLGDKDGNMPDTMGMSSELSSNLSAGLNFSTEVIAASQIARQQLRIKRKEERVSSLVGRNEGEAVTNIYQRRKDLDENILGKYSIWHRENDIESDSFVRLLKDQVIMARVYASIAQSQNLVDLQRELNSRIRESRHILEDVSLDVDLPPSASEKIKAMGATLSKARRVLYDCKAIAKKLRAMLQSSDEKTLSLNKQSTILRQLVAKTLPKGIHCLSMLLTSEYFSLSDEQQIFPSNEKLEDPSLFHYALFSDNVIAAAVVVNSTVNNAKEPEKHVFHVVTDKLNIAAMKMWFLANPPGRATITIENIDEFKWLNATYCPVLRQLQTSSMKEYYFKSDHSTTLADASSNLKYRNPKYLSMLNHLRFYLPEVYPKLDKVLFLDDDIVVQKDLTQLWSIDLHGNVNGAVETCGESFHRFDKYLNFSNPLISKNFNPDACGWAYGMNVFDLQEWRKKDITGVYHKWQNLNENRELWKLGTLPPGLMTFYNLTYPLDKSWHVLGLGYDPHVEPDEIDRAAVIHYNGNMKPWLELAMSKYKSYWTKYVNYSNPYLQQCNVIS